MRANTGRNFFCYRRTVGKDSFYIEINLTSKRQKRPAPVAGMELLISNYTARSDSLRPYEANVYRAPIQ